MRPILSIPHQSYRPRAPHTLHVQAVVTRPIQAKVSSQPTGEQTSAVIPRHIHQRLEIYVKQSNQYLDNVDILTHRAEAAPESNSNLQSGYHDLRSLCHQTREKSNQLF